MNQFAAALAGAVTAVGVGSVVLARCWPLPTGRHPAPRPAADTEVLRPADAPERFEAHCPAEDRPTLQIRLRPGGAMCTECRNPTTATTTGGQP
ncbi:hypothetical protein ACFVOR_14830 [Streptomyces sp. NPDC057837]|uniref:hypothetical protein n=1 Tax=Streptomyces sp. NPDC057837 TaxID=3346260 RepID=UPI0036B4A34F